MKHSIQDLKAVAYRYFPRGIWGHDPAYTLTPEYRCLQEARARAVATYKTVWRPMLHRIEARLPQERKKEIFVQDLSLDLALEGREPDCRACSAYLWLPPREAAETAHTLTFRVSFVVPCYAIQSSWNEYSKLYYYRMAPGPGSHVNKTSWMLSPDEEAFAGILAEEIVASYPGYEPFPPEAGEVLLPDAAPDSRCLGEATLFDCLFSTHF